MNRPPFAVAWAASQRIFDPIKPSEKVAKIVGGKVSENILPLGERGKWKNTCAVRMSYILNASGARIPHTPGKTVSGGDHNWYFFYVKDVIKFLKKSWGEPDLIAAYPPAGGGDLVNRKGIVMFEVSGWGDATGHATLWNGTQCYDHCYFNEPNVNYRTTSANFWGLS